MFPNFTEILECLQDTLFSVGGGHKKLIYKFNLKRMQRTDHLTKKIEPRSAYTGTYCPFLFNKSSAETIEGTVQQVK
jgi:hypothetical protein